MVDPKILESSGTNQAALKALCTAPESDHALCSKRKKLEEMVQDRITEGVEAGVRNHKIFMAVDLAWDAPPVGRETIPLQLYAQDKLKLETVCQELEAVNCAEEFVVTDPKTKKVKINFPKLYEVAPSVLRSITLRRVYAQTSRFSNRWPFYQYEPRSTIDRDRLRGEITSQRMEIMSDQFGHRHFWSQAILNTFLYGFTTAFPAEGWTTDKQLRKINGNDGITSIDSVIEREGVDFVMPHPTRVFWDSAYPLASLNQGNLGWVGYWDVIRYGDIASDPTMWNTDAVGFSSQLINFYQLYSGYFSYYYGKNTINGPSSATNIPSLANDRKAIMGVYTSADKDASVFLTNLYVRLKPNQWGLGNYPYYVWTRLVVAGDCTIVGGEFLTTTSPATYGGINQNDSRQISASPAHEIIPYQDQVTNILSQILMVMKRGLAQIWVVNQDLLDDDVKDYIRDSMKGENWFVEAKLLLFSGHQAAQLGLSAADVVRVIETSMREKITELFDALVKLLSIMDRMLNLSPNEVGQPMKSETSATETAVIQTTSETISTAIADGLDEMFHSSKRLLYESLVMNSESEVNVPIKSRFTVKTVRDAGFTDFESSKEIEGEDIPKSRTVIGPANALIHDYVFSSRDGQERPLNTEIARTSMQMLAQILQMAPVAQSLGKRRVFGMINDIVRRSGIGIDLNLELQEGEDDNIGPAPEQRIEQVEQAIQQIMQMLSQQQAASAAPAPQAQIPGSGLPVTV